jgi:hypothetical protein
VVTQNGDTKDKSLVTNITALPDEFVKKIAQNEAQPLFLSK